MKLQHFRSFLFIFIFLLQSTKKIIKNDQKFSKNYHIFRHNGRFWCYVSGPPFLCGDEQRTYRGSKFFASYLACQYPRVQPLSGCKCTSQTYLDQNTGSMGKQKWVPQKRRIFVSFSRLHSKLFFILRLGIQEAVGIPIRNSKMDF